MNLLKLKKQWNLGINIILVAMLFIVIETTYFLIEYGLNYRANQDAIIRNSIASFILLSVIFRLFDYFIDRLK